MSDPRASDLHQQLVRLLADGQWHDYHAILSQAAKTVQPGAAIRACERTRQNASRRRHGEAKTRAMPLSTSEQIRRGSRQLAQTRMLNRAFEIDPSGWQPPGTSKRIRLRPKPAVRPPTRQPQWVLPAPTDSNPDALQVRPDSRRRPYLQVVLDRLEDGRWHSLEAMVELGMEKVDEDRALRQARVMRVRGGTSNRAQTLTHEQTVRVGAHSVTYQSLVCSALVEVQGRGPARRIRLRRP